MVVEDLECDMPHSIVTVPVGIVDSYRTYKFKHVKINSSTNSADLNVWSCMHSKF